MGGETSTVSVSSERTGECNERGEHTHMDTRQRILALEARMTALEDILRSAGLLVIPNDDLMAYFDTHPMPMVGEVHTVDQDPHQLLLSLASPPVAGVSNAPAMDV